MSVPNIDEAALITDMQVLSSRILRKAQTTHVYYGHSAIYSQIRLGHTRAFLLQKEQVETLADRAAELVYKAALRRRRDLLKQLWEAYSISLRQQQLDLDRIRRQKLGQLWEIMVLALQAALERILAAHMETEPDSGLVTATAQFIFAELPHLVPATATEQDDDNEEGCNDAPHQ
jgi:hypothetical protein